MEHRPLPHHSPAIRRYLNETEFHWYARILAAKEPDRERFYVDSHKAQLRNVRQNVSRREPSQANRLPFLCVFHFAGCDGKFGNKRDWKDHVGSQHLPRRQMFWECTEGDCAHSKDTLEQCKSLQTNWQCDPDELWLNDAGGWHFANSHDFRTHLIQRHRPTKPHDIKEDSNKILDKEVQWLLDRSDSSMRMACGLPQDLCCPMPQCASVRFTGPAAWDQRLDHAAEHFLASPQCLGVFGGEKDTELMQWASCNAVGILEQTPNPRLQQHNCGMSIADSGYSSMPGMPRNQNMSQHGDSFPAVPSNLSTFRREKLSPVFIGGRARDHEYLASLIGEDTISSAYQSFIEMFSAHESAGDHRTLDTSQDSESADESDGTSDRNQETAAVMQWFHGWLRQWLAPLTQERPTGNRSRQSTDSQRQNSTSTSSTQRNKGTSRPRLLPKRKRVNDDEDEGNEEGSKSQRIDGDPEIRMLACPFFKRNPRKYGQRKWKSCAYPGYETMHRLKEHIERRHSLPEYQCRRCRVDLKTSEALEAHSQQLQACTPCIVAQDGLNQDQVKKMKRKKGTGKNKSNEDRWNDVYSIVFPHDQQKPSPYLDNTDQDNSAREFNLCHEFSRFLTRELPSLVGRRLSTIGCPFPETIKDDTEQYVKELIPQLQVTFLGEMGFAADESNGQLDVPSTTNDGASFVESTTTRRTSEDSATTVQQDSTSEYPTTTLPKGSTSQEAMSMFPTGHDSKELTVMPQVGYDTANSTMLQDGNFSGHDMMFPASQMMPPYLSTTNEDWQAFWQFGYNPNLP